MTPKTKATVQALWRLQKIILNSLDFNQVAQAVVNGLLTELGYLQLGYRIIVLSLVDKEKGILRRISLSQTEEATKALSLSPVSFNNIDIPLGESQNLLVRCVAEKRALITHDWYDVLRPVLTKEETSIAQIAAGIKTSMVFPVMVRDQAIGALIFSLIKEESEVSPEEKELIGGFTDIVGLAVQDARLYSELQSANDRLLEFDKLKDEFISIASHDLRTPIATVKNFIWLTLNGQDQLSDKVKDNLDRAYNAAERTAVLVSDMLDVSRIEAGRIEVKMQVLDLEKVIGEIKDDATSKATAKNVILTIDPASGMKIMADHDRLLQIINNLVDNAIKFTPTKGTVTVTIKAENGKIGITVTDTGIGIDQKDFPKLFTKFGRLHNTLSSVPEAPGTGLGLYITKKLVELLGGTITVTSEVGKGTTFACIFQGA